MNEQPETIQISTALELMPELIKTLHFEAAAELQRLHEVNQELLKILAYVEASDLGSMLCARARAAIAKARGEG